MLHGKGRCPMKRAGVGGFFAVGRPAGAPRPASPTDPGAREGAKRHLLLELQWQDRSGRFRHLALSSLGLRRVLGAFGSVVFFAIALAVVVTFSMRSNRVQAHFGVDAVLRENAALRERQDALRARAFDLAEQLYVRVERGRRMVRLAGTTARGWEHQCPRPPARDAGNEALLAWLSVQAVRLEAIENALAVGQVEMDVKRASLEAPVSRRRVPVGDGAVLLVADTGAARRPKAGQ
jgi:hypothetical protein